VNYRREVIEEHFGDGSAFGCEIAYLREDPERPLGTAGSLRLLPDRPGDPLLVMNGDLVTQFAVSDLLAAHAREGAMATMAVSDYAHAVPFGVCETDGGRLVRLREKPTSTWLVNAGIYVLDPSLLDHVPAGREFHVPQVLLGCLHRGEPVATWRMADEWLDVGRPSELRRAVGAP
jgi:NDP-sugar pyrophosphorylase family protein